jgi:transposase
MDENTIKKQYSPHKRTRIVMKYDAGIKPSIIAAEEGVPVNSIRGIAKRYRVQKSATSMKRSGRPTTITERDKRVLLRIIANNPSIKNIDLLREAGLECSISTLTRYL